MSFGEHPFSSCGIDGCTICVHEKEFKDMQVEPEVTE
jgi:hypothetical protein